MSITLSQARQHHNHLLAKLTEEQLWPLLSLIELVDTKVGDVLLRQGHPIEYVYFPIYAAHSCLVYMEGGSAVEVGTIGNESFTGIELLFDATLATETVICQIAGKSFRISINDFRGALKDGRALTKILKCGGQAYLAQVSQSVACNRLHSTDMRFARWLLISHDRAQGDEFFITQDFIAAMLGVHRPSVSVIASLFQQAGMIRYTRGHIKIVDRAKLEESSCECYAAIRSQYKRLLGVAHG